MARYRSISFLLRVFSVSLPFGGDFPGHLANVKNKTTRTGAGAHRRKRTPFTHIDTRARTGKRCHTSLPLFFWTYGNVSGSQEIFANVRTCGWLGTRPHVQLCRGRLANRCTPPPCTSLCLHTQEGN